MMTTPQAHMLQELKKCGVFSRPLTVMPCVDLSHSVSLQIRSMPFHRFLLTAAFKWRTYGSAVLSGIPALRTDLSCMALTIVIVHAFCRFAVNGSAVRCDFHRIAVTSFSSLLKAVAASLLCCFCCVPADLDLVKGT